MASAVARLSDLAEGQWGLVTRAQARRLGIAWSTLSHLAGPEGVLERIAHGVYRLRGSADPGHLSLRAAWLQLDPATPAWERLDQPGRALVSHSSAAVLYDVGDLRADTHEFTLPVRRQTRRRDVRLHRGQVPEQDWLILHGLPTTRAGRMAADLLADHHEPEAVAQIVRELLDQVYDHPRAVAEKLGPVAARFDLLSNDGVSVLDLLLTMAGHPDRDRLL
ncbi:MAG TPA: type IV toxin-antitoxin system AbiEi family antitoxin domain-containing protein, partial [Pseudonocardiaceae bacterium]|nr:type IV toxin-antitoxin system AbiEi family antitoxin domain-containing protein [Pseudonocardiaceae bacterium]